jgi:methylmalonyl-CoA/ethylmalonyl-CoA epimerase
MTQEAPQATHDTRLHLGPCVQVGIVVRDIYATMAQWEKHFDFPPARIIDWPLEGTGAAGTAMYRGQPANFRMRIAFLETGSVQFEFIQPLEGDNIYSEFLDAHGEGLHHVLFSVTDPDGVARTLEVPVLQSGGSTLFPGATWSYLDTQSLLGMMIELRSKR